MSPNPTQKIEFHFTQVQEAAVRNFIQVWNLSMPYHDIGPALNCGETNALHGMLLAFGAIEAADALMAAHVQGDDLGDDPAHLHQRNLTPL